MVKTKGDTDILNKFLADTYALALKTHDYHWNVTGAEFCNLHSLFENQYKDLVDAADTIAERIRALGEYAAGGVHNFAKNTSIEEPRRDLDADSMLAFLIVDHTRLADRALKAVNRLFESGDHATADILIRRIQMHEKQIWMMKSICDEKKVRLSGANQQVA